MLRTFSSLLALFRKILSPTLQCLLCVCVAGIGYFVLRPGEFFYGFQLDSVDYVDQSYLNPFSIEALSSIRTIGYPLFLKVVRKLTGDYFAVPAIQWFAHIGSLMVLLYSFLRFGLPRRQSTLVVCLLIFSTMTLGRQYNTIGTDSLGLTMAICMVAYILLAVATGKKKYFIGVAFFAFCAVILRPAYLFLVVFAPTFMFLVQSQFLGISLSLKKRIQGSLWVATSVCVPLMLFCAFRFAKIGDFHLVNLGGNTFFGVVGQFLTPEMVPKLPKELQEPARVTIDRREQLSTVAKVQWTSPYVGRFDIYRKQVHDMQGLICWWVGWEGMNKLYQRDGQRANQTLEALSWAIVRLNPITYLIWIAKSFFVAFQYLWNSISFFYPCVVSILLFMATYFCKAAMNKGEVFSMGLSKEERKFMHLAGLLGFLFFNFKILLVVMTNAAVERFVMPATFFLQMIPLCTIGILLARIPMPKFHPKFNFGRVKNPISSKLFTDSLANSSRH